jgi:hypothetical protein
VTRAESVTDQRRCTFGRAFYEVGKGRLPVLKIRPVSVRVRLGLIETLWADPHVGQAPHTGRIEFAWNEPGSEPTQTVSPSVPTGDPFSCTRGGARDDRGGRGDGMLVRYPAVGAGGSPFTELP